MSKNPTDRNNAAVTNWVKLGNELTGNAIGALIGSYFAGSAGGVIGASITPLITETVSKIGYDFKGIFFGKREQVRIGATFSYALDKIKERLDAGETPRDNSFFTGSGDNRAASEEILDAALRLAQKEHEELKIKHYGYLVANIYFDERIDRAHANLLISIADKLSYRKLLLLELLYDKERFGLQANRKTDSLNDTRPANIVNGVNLSTYSSAKLSLRGRLKHRRVDLKMEIDELASYHLIANHAMTDLTLIRDSIESVELTEIGLQLRRLMELKELSQGDLEDVASIL